MLVDTLLTVDSRKRPNINQILKFPIISEKIGRFLKEDIFKDEFLQTGPQVLRLLGVREVEECCNRRILHCHCCISILRRLRGIQYLLLPCCLSINLIQISTQVQGKSRLMRLQELSYSFSLIIHRVFDLKFMSQDF